MVNETFKRKYGGKRILIAGFARSGRAALGALSGVAGYIAVYDAKAAEAIGPDTDRRVAGFGAEPYFGGAAPPADARFDMVVLSPGVPPEIAAVRAAVAAGATLTGDLDLAFDFGPALFVAITGTNGKTTTTALTGGIWKNAGRVSEVTGNIGTPVVESVMNAPTGCEFITEVSSFQLDAIEKGGFRPHIAALLNLTPDHLDRYKTMENYGAAKARVFMNQGKDDFLVLNADDAGVMALATRAAADGRGPGKILFSRKTRVEDGAFAEDGKLFVAQGGAARYLMDTADIYIPGNHNLENALAAAAMAVCGGIADDIIADTLRHFKGVAHRMELIDVIDGVRFVNDSKGTNTDASQKAIDAIADGIILIAGGYEKNADFTEFIRGFGGKVKHAVLLGETAERFAETAAANGFTDYTIVKDMDEAVRLGYRLAQPGFTVLLSPASASWDRYDNFEQRGDHFRALVAELKERVNAASE
ncbi:MAG: UDP-N-acetylmuramoyl-L-alanine--D-glutamate ligase [Clostridiales Family XIII bacterium]|jgi:UDP-N-acetylmuramoylalanine--D-glutamate ligase|nr:UDP-N-acetylmuramoyl-L-alanine--D-glutamate ligase [Clostridiales Family XIII bacterium]